jgi:hypothetical protein
MEYGEDSIAFHDPNRDSRLSSHSPVCTAPTHKAILKEALGGN